MAVPQPLKWHGGKGAFNGKLAKWIISLMPPHTHYVEPFFGGGAVLLHKDPEGVSEVVNDLNGELVNFWNVLRCDNSFAILQHWLEATPFCEATYESACQHKPPADEMLNTSAAFAFFVRCRQSMAGRMKSFAPLSRTRTRQGMNEQAAAWLTAVNGLPEVHARMRRVAVLGRPALDVIKQQDGPQTLYYLDPSYPHETRTAKSVYEHEMTTADHLELLDVLERIKGKFILSGYRCEMYDKHAERCGWRREEFSIVNNSAGGSAKRVMTECIWMNYENADEPHLR